MAKTPTPTDRHGAGGDGSTAPVHLSVLLDRSGSMASFGPAVVDGCNHLLVEQQAQPGKARLTLAQFDDQAPFDVLVDAVKLAKVPPLRHDQLAPRGMTPLYDAMGALLDRAEARIRRRRAAEKPAEDQLVVVFTDGLENASRRCTRQDVFDRVAARKAEGWTFVFLGANQDAYAAGHDLAVDAGNVSGFDGDAAGLHAAFRSVSRATSAYRAKPSQGRRHDAAEFFEGVKEAEQGR